MKAGRIVDSKMLLDDEGLFRFNAPSLCVDGGRWLSASLYFAGTIEASGDHLVILGVGTESMLGNNLTIALQMTPEGARTIAAELIVHAQKVETHVAEQAAAAIEAARLSNRDKH